MQVRPYTECQGIVGIKGNCFLDESCTSIHIGAGQCKDEGCKRHYIRVGRIQSNCLLSYLDQVEDLRVVPMPKTLRDERPATPRQVRKGARVGGLEFNGLP